MSLMMNENPTYSLDNKPEGKNYSQWTGEWWKFVLSQGAIDNPFSENTPGSPVYFFGTPFKYVTKTPAYEYDIPKGTPALFAVANHFVYSVDDSYENLLDRANRYVNSVTHKIATIHEEGHTVTPLTPVRAYTVVNGIKHTEKFRKGSHDTTEKGKPGEIKDGTVLKAVADGYWVFLKSLTKGKYEVRTYGEMDDHLKQTRFAPQQHTTLNVT
jgi:hypothetical protein